MKTEVVSDVEGPFSSFIAVKEKQLLNNETLAFDV